VVVIGAFLGNEAIGDRRVRERNLADRKRGVVGEKHLAEPAMALQTDLLFIVKACGHHHIRHETIFPMDEGVPKVAAYMARQFMRT
jgi:hypothetical protein